MNPSLPNTPAPGAPAPLYPGQEPMPGTAFLPQPQAPAPPPSVAMPAPMPQPVVQQPLPPAPQQPIYPQQPLPQPIYASPPQASVVPGAAPAPVTGQPAAGAPLVKPATPANTNSTQNSLVIAEIRDGIVIMNDGSFRSVVMVKSVNFDLMSPQEQEAVEFSYQGFLNSLYFPIQIFIRSQKVDLEPYLQRLDKIRSEHDNMLLSMLMEDYLHYIDQLSQQTNIMDKKFYVVIPYFPHEEIKKAITQSKNFVTGLINLFNTKEDHVVINEADLEKAKNELRNRVQAVLQGLQQAGIQGLPLDTQELIELYYDAYNPDTATRQQLKNFDDLAADVITKGVGAAPQAHLQRELN